MELSDSLFDRGVVVNGPVAIGVGRYPSRHIHTEANPLRDRRGLSRFADCRGLRADSGRGNSRVVNDRQVSGRPSYPRKSTRMSKSQQVRGGQEATTNRAQDMLLDFLRDNAACPAYACKMP